MEEQVDALESEASNADATEKEWSSFGACLFCLAESFHEPTELCETQENAGSVLAVAEKIGYKELGEYKDPISTGRKRAANILPDESLGECEWAWLAKAGGGVVPIIGCDGKQATDRHHGPDKSTFNNTRPGEGNTNLHAICSFCHNAWHAANDPFYGANGKEDRPADNSTWVPVGDVEWFEHDPDSQASESEVLEVMIRRVKEAMKKRKKKNNGA